MSFVMRFVAAGGALGLRGPRSSCTATKRCCKKDGWSFVKKCTCCVHLYSEAALETAVRTPVATSFIDYTTAITGWKKVYDRYGLIIPELEIKFLEFTVSEVAV